MDEFKTSQLNIWAEDFEKEYRNKRLRRKPVRPSETVLPSRGCADQTIEVN